MLTIRRIFDMNKSDVIEKCYTQNEMVSEELVSMYEAKMIDQFNHRRLTYDIVNGRRSVELSDLENREFNVLPRYWICNSEVKDKIEQHWNKRWLLVWQDVTDVNTMSRSVISTIIPWNGTDFTLRVGFPIADPVIGAVAFESALNSFCFDYVARQKIGGTHLSDYILKQLPLPTPGFYHGSCSWDYNETVASWIKKRVLELNYTSNDMRQFALDLSYNGSPFTWNENRRFLIRCELDGAYFHIYQIDRDSVDYIMETFPIVKRRDEEKFGEYRTKRVILEIYDAMAEAMKRGKEYQTILDPPPADPRVVHLPRN